LYKKLVRYRKLAPMLVTKIVRFDWSVVFESFWYIKFARRAAFYSLQVFLRKFKILERVTPLLKTVISTTTNNRK